MLSDELGTILVEPVGDEHGNIVHPCITRCSRQQDPVVILGDLDERLDPRTFSHKTLLIEDEEVILIVDILPEIVPAVDGQDLLDIQSLTSGFTLPVKSVALLGGSDHDKTLRRFVLQV